jgi:4-diphosphocytidyl-2-C-methyl-D-erythritol kinase
MRLLAPAKINWTLEVLGRRQDGYHEIRSVLQTIDLADEVELVPADKLQLEASGPHRPSGDDLALRAARLLREESKYEGGARIRLSKRIPLAAGLGGGSSDAATVLRGLDSLWGLGWPPERLAALAAKVSSDAPFFIFAGTALAEGRGERVTPLPDVPPTRLVLVVPPWQEADKTARMYANLGQGDHSDGSGSQRLVEALRNGSSPDEALICNAFQRAAYANWPDLARYRDALLAAGAGVVHLAGSGPALFALAHSNEEAGALLSGVGGLPGLAIVAHTLTAAAATRLEP